MPVESLVVSTVNVDEPILLLVLLGVNLGLWLRRWRRRFVALWAQYGIDGTRLSVSSLDQGWFGARRPRIHLVQHHNSLLRGSLLGRHSLVDKIGLFHNDGLLNLTRMEYHSALRRLTRSGSAPASGSMGLHSSQLLNNMNFVLN